VWDDGSAISGGTVSGPTNSVVNPGAQVGVSMSAASDEDHWTKGDEEDTEGDSISYQWSASDGSFEGATDGVSATWVAPNEAGNYTITGTAIDGGVVPAGDGGERDDTNVSTSITLSVPPKEWSPDTPIGQDKDGMLNGRLTAPQNQTLAASEWQGQVVKVAKGAKVGCAVEAATDWDKWTQGTKSEREEDSLIYAWSAPQGSFSSASSASTQWTAPQQVGWVTLTCTINDTPKAIGSGDTGSRDDTGAITRTVTIQVVDGPQVTFEGKFPGELTSGGVLRACAGGIDDHAASEAQYRAHTRFITAKAEQNGQAMSGASLRFAFKDNKGHDYTDDPPETKPAGWTISQIKTARLLEGNSVWVESLTHSTNSEGKVALTVKSSDVISQPMLEAYWTNEQGQEVLVGSVECDFDEATSIRRFIDPFDYAAEDTGWLFNREWLGHTGSQTTAKIYMKFMVDSELGDVDGNWQFVNGHHMLVSVAQVNDQPIDTFTQQTSYVTVLPPNPDQTATTQGDGAATVLLQAGNDVDQVSVVSFVAYDQDQWDE
jgi:hypothetical protein